AALAKHAIKVGAPVWDGLASREGLLTVLPETQDQFVPQMVNFDRVGALSFKKGCYPGQEIVARTQYRGILKRRMAWVHGDSDPAPKPGDPVFAAAFGDQAAGQVAEVAPAPAGGFDALVVAQIEAIQSDSLRLISPDGAILKVMPLPYPLA
ncbi:MAG: folate-binding protein, partial [Betaproteobacteria bacterium]|nr:folate-binding protein [Betaproteobacteria bacterium]